MSAYRPLSERFWEKVNKAGPNECWLWTAGLHKSGYGSIGINGKSVLAHRLSYLWANGNLPEDLAICHKCDERKCVNPAHLFVGTLSDNNADRHNKGRSRGASHKGTKNPMAILTEEKVREIAASEGSLKEIGKKFGIPFGCVSEIKRGKSWSSVTGIEKTAWKVNGLAPKQRALLCHIFSLIPCGSGAISIHEIASDLGYPSGRHVAWARHKLARKGYIRRIRNNIWELTQKGKETAQGDAP